MRVLQNGNEISRGKQAVFRIVPSRQSLQPAQSSGENPDQRLIVDTDILLFNRCSDMGNDIFAGKKGFRKSRIIKCADAVKTSLAGKTGQPRPVQHDQRGAVVFLNFIDTGFYQHLKRRMKGTDFFVNLKDVFLHVLPGSQYREPVFPDSCTGLIVERLLDQPAGISKQFIPRLCAKRAVDQLEILNVEKQKPAAPEIIGDKELAYLRLKAGIIQKSSQRII